jgi:hypothetical protein
MVISSQAAEVARTNEVLEVASVAAEEVTKSTLTMTTLKFKKSKTNRKMKQENLLTTVTYSDD